MVDSFALVDSLKGLQFMSGWKLASLDATSLFTSVPVDLCLSVIANCLLSEPSNTLLEPQDFVELLSLCVCNVQFLFNGVYYRQIDGAAMGNIFKGHIENMVQDTIYTDAMHTVTLMTFW